jgi:hypothetical protein
MTREIFQKTSYQQDNHQVIDRNIFSETVTAGSLEKRRSSAGVWRNRYKTSENTDPLMSLFEHRDESLFLWIPSARYDAHLTQFTFMSCTTARHHMQAIQSTWPQIPRSLKRRTRADAKDPCDTGLDGPQFRIL